MPVQTPSKIRCFNSVSRYLQGPGTSDLLYDLVAANGKALLPFWTPFSMRNTASGTFSNFGRMI